MKNENKTARINMRVTPSLDSQVREVAEQLSISRNELIERGIVNYVLDHENFAWCPTCNTRVFDIERITIISGISEVECSNGHTHYFDFEDNKWVK